MQLKPVLALLLTTAALLCYPAAAGNQIPLSQSLFLPQYATVRVIIKNNILPSKSNFTLQITSFTPKSNASAAGSATATPVYSSVLGYRQNDSIFTLYNHQKDPQTVNISLVSAANTQVPQKVMVVGRSKQEKTFVALIDNKITDGFMLPFNMLDTKVSRLLVLQHKATLKSRNNKQAPFTTTYWTENQIKAAVLPWLPYFSNCDYTNKYILLNDILQLQECSSHPDQALVCSPKSMQFQCIIEEMEINSNNSSKFWFDRTSGILFYFYPTQLGFDEIEALRSNSNNLTSIIASFHQNLIPVVYYSVSSDKGKVNRFEWKIVVLVQKGQSSRISYAEVVGSYDSSLTSQNGVVSITINYDRLQSFVYYGLSIHWYVLFSCAFVGLLLLLLCTVAKRQSSCRLGEKVKLMVAPALKGVALSLLTAGMFVVLMHFLSSLTNYSAISSSYNGGSSSQEIQITNIGRYGLTLFITGLYILTTGIKQSFKVNEQEQLRLAFEDDRAKFESEEQLKHKIEFCRANLFSYRKYLFNGAILSLAIGLFKFRTFSNFSRLTLALLQLLVLPLLSSWYTHFQNEHLVKSHLFACASAVSGSLLTALFVLANQNIYELSYLYLCNYLSGNLMCLLYEHLTASLLLRLDHYRQLHRNCRQHWLPGFLCRLFQKRISALKTQSQYEKALYYSSFNVSVLIKIFLHPFCLLFVYLTQNQTQISKILMVRDYSLLVPLLLGLLGMVLQIYTVLVVVEWLRLKLGIRIQQAMKYNRFRFGRIKYRWMIDVFAQSKYVREEFRQFQKFVFSSQLYFVISLKAIGLLATFFGLLTMVEAKYLPFSDPVSLIVLTAVGGLGEILSVLVSVVALRLKIYEKKGGEGMRQQLVKMQKYLKAEQQKEYLQLQGVKEYFMDQHKDWIIHNLHRIFSRQDLKQHPQLITKYKQYKRSFKRKQLDLKRQQLQRRLNCAQAGHPAITQAPYLVVKSKLVFSVASPILTYWHSLAKQNLYLKRIVACVQRQKIKPVCEYCNMDIYLEALEKYDFHDIVNSFRVENVGKVFDQSAFLQFYRIYQQYLTICFECKQRNLHLHTKIDKRSVAAKLMLCWLMAARSTLLHAHTNSQRPL